MLRQYTFILGIGCLLLLSSCSLTTSKSRPTKLTLNGKLPGNNQANVIHVSYRTESGRLNVASRGKADSLPDLTDSKLYLLYPHPQGRPGCALATLLIVPPKKESNWLDRWREDDASDKPEEPLDRRVLDIPARDVRAIVDRLRKDNFFHRSSPLVIESHVGVQLNDAGFAKNFGAVPVLDSLILKVYRESHVGIATPGGPWTESRTALRRLPPTNQWMTIKH